MGGGARHPCTLTHIVNPPPRDRGRERVAGGVSGSTQIGAEHAGYALQLRGSPPGATPFSASLGAWVRFSGLWFRGSVSRFRDSGFSFRISGFGFRFSGFGFRVLGFRFRVWGLDREIHQHPKALDVQQSVVREVQPVAKHNILGDFSLLRTRVY